MHRKAIASNMIHSARTNNPDSLSKALAMGGLKFATESDAHNAMLFAAFSDDDSCCRILLDAGASLLAKDARGRTVLQAAVEIGESLGTLEPSTNHMQPDAHMAVGAIARLERLEFEAMRQQGQLEAPTVRRARSI